MIKDVVQYGRTSSWKFINRTEIWKTVSVSGDQLDHFLMPGIGEKKGQEDETNRSINQEFKGPYFTIYGMQVRFLKVVEKSGYTTSPWVRYKLRAGDYQIRM